VRRCAGHSDGQTASRFAGQQRNLIFVRKSCILLTSKAPCGLFGVRAGVVACDALGLSARVAEVVVQVRKALAADVDEARYRAGLRLSWGIP
jgi:hypothetical protein